VRVHEYEYVSVCMLCRISIFAFNHRLAREHGPRCKTKNHQVSTGRKKGFGTKRVAWYLYRGKCLSYPGRPKASTPGGHAPSQTQMYLCTNAEEVSARDPDKHATKTVIKLHSEQMISIITTSISDWGGIVLIMKSTTDNNKNRQNKKALIPWELLARLPVMHNNKNHEFDLPICSGVNSIKRVSVGRGGRT
jgi:hypothetical protein